MDEEQFESELKDILDLLDVFSDIDETPVSIDSVKSFENAGILTINKGLIIRLSDKSEWQMTIVKTR